MIIANSEHLGETFALFDQLNESQAILDNELIWKQMNDYGVNVIQTDWPNFLKEYRQSFVNVN